MEPLISVIIPVYNIKKYLPFCLDNILNQTYENIEVMIVDDGSFDGTSKVCDEYAEKDQRVKIIHKSNEGQSVARNVALKNVEGEYVIFIDGDDWVRNDYIRVLFDVAMKYDADIVNCNFVRTSRVGKVDGDLGSFTEIEFDSQAAIESLCYMKELSCAPYSKLFKKEIWNELEFPIGFIYEDLATIYKTYDIANRIVYIDYNGYFYFQRKGSSLNSIFNEKKLSRIDFSEEILDFVKAHYPQIVNAAYCRLFWSASGALMDIPWSYDNTVRKKQIIHDIKNSRLIVLKDSNCKCKIRCLAMLSFWGISIYEIVLNVIKKVSA